MHPQGVYYMVQQQRKRQEEKSARVSRGDDGEPRRIINDAGAQRCSIINTAGVFPSLPKQNEEKEALDNPPPLIRQSKTIGDIPNEKMTPRKNPVIQRKSQLYPAAKALFNQRRRPSIEEKPELSSVAQEESPDDT